MSLRSILFLLILACGARAQTEEKAQPEPPAEAKPAETESSAADPPRPAPAPSALDSASIQDHLVIVEGDNGAGSGSIIVIDGQPKLVTNAHVISGNSKLTFKLLNGQEVKCTQFEVSATEDLARGAPTGVTTGLSILEAADKAAKIGDEIVVYGNSDGGGVVREISGVIKGIGPTEIEVDAEFVSGNSGSPVIHKKTGKVLAVATYVIIPNVNEVNKATELTQPRRFCIRMDQAKKWESPSWKKFTAEWKKLEEFHNNSVALSLAGLATQRALLFGLGREQSADLKAVFATLPVNPFVTAVNRDFATVADRDWARVVEADRKTQLALFMRRFTRTLFDDMRIFRPEHFTAYHRKVYEREIKFRELLKKRFEEMIAVANPHVLPK